MTDLSHSRNLAALPLAGCFHHLFFLPVLITIVGLIMICQLRGQTFTTLHDFSPTEWDASFGSANVWTNGDGAWPQAGLILLNNSLYGTAYQGGSSGNGTVFAVQIDGTGFTNLHSFTATAPYPGPYANSDGAWPQAGLILLNNSLCGTAYQGGSSGHGTVFEVNAEDTGFTTLHSFTPLSGGAGGAGANSDGAYPVSSLILLGNTLYGTTPDGGASGYGAVFKVNADGSGFTNLHSFTAGSGPYPGSNSDGAFPAAGLILSNNTLYGTAAWGGSSGNGTLFKVNADGTGFTTLHSFAGPINVGYGSTNSDGANPAAGVILSGTTLYGTAEFGGSSGIGTVFAVNIDGTGFRTLHSFTAPTNFPENADGFRPRGNLILAGSTLYGTTYYGGSWGSGTVFALNADGTGFTTLYHFSSTGSDWGSHTNDDGANPNGGLILSANTLYGTARFGGYSGNGTVFSLSFRPELTIIPSVANVILAWPTNAAGFTLHSTTNLGSSPIWTTNSAAPVVINGQNTVTNPISGTQQFFRLSQ